MSGTSFRHLTAAALLCLALAGCARTAKDTSGFAVSNSTVVQAGFDETWQAVKSVLREQDYNIYTRDKRGTFVAYSGEKRSWFQPKRVKYTVELRQVSRTETSIQVEAVRQIYGVTALTYPGWHDRKLEDRSGADALIAAVLAKLSTAAAETAPAPPTENLSEAQDLPS